MRYSTEFIQKTYNTNHEVIDPKGLQHLPSLIVSISSGLISSKLSKKRVKHSLFKLALTQGIDNTFSNEK